MSLARRNVMSNNVKEMAHKYLETHPQIKKIMDDFKMSQEEYERALSAMSLSVKKEELTCSLTTEGDYNVNISGPT